MIRISTGVWVVCLLAAAACSPSNEGAGPARAGGAPVAAPPLRTLPPVSAQAAAFYRRAFPKAKTFVAKPIPPEMLRSLDTGNDIYIQAYGDAGATLGYLRDFSGKVTLGEDCACAPLSLTLVFDAERNFQDILTNTPLTKKNHKLMTEADVARLVAIGRDPPKALIDERRTESMVDATTGATKPAFVDSVVPNAAFSSHRLVGVVRDTERILQGAPLAIDRQRLQALMAQYEDKPSKAAVALAELLPTVDSDEVGVEAYRLMTRAYVEHLRDGGKVLGGVELRLVEPKVADEYDMALALDACYRLVGQSQHSKVAATCAARWSKDAPAELAPLVARLRGSLLSADGNTAEAVAPLRDAAHAFPVAADPTLHLRLGEALRAQGNLAEACSTGRQLFLEHPLFTGAKKLLSACQPDSGDVVAVLEELYGYQRQALLAQRVYGNAQVPNLPVEDHNLTGVDLQLYEPGKVTVAMFFATWCPHCQLELPRLVAFERAMEGQRDLGGKVRVIGVRTSVEKEDEPFDAFMTRNAVRFPVWTDPVMSMAFSKFVKSQGLAGTIPVVAVIDDAGYVKYFLEPGDYRDTARELVWAVRDVLDNPTREPVPPPPAPGADAGS